MIDQTSDGAKTADQTVTQPHPNLSTEHQRRGDARRPADTLDRGQDPATDHTETQPRRNASTED